MSETSCFKVNNNYVQRDCGFVNRIRLVVVNFLFENRENFHVYSKYLQLDFGFWLLEISSFESRRQFHSKT